MACTVTATAKSGKYSIVTDYITDPSRNTRADAASSSSRHASAGYQLYVRFDPTVNGNGGGGGGNGGADSATVDTSTGHPVLVASDTEHGDERGEPRLRAAGLRRARRLASTQATSGFAGTRERRARPARRLARAHADVHRRDQRQRRPDRARRSSPADGKARARARLRRDAGRGGRRRRGLARQRASTRRSRDYEKGWKQYDDALNKPPHREAAGLDDADAPAARGRVLPERERGQGVRGQDVPRRDRREPRLAVGPGDLGRRPGNTYFGSYREVFARDLYEAWTGLVADGDLATARDATLFLFDRQQQPDGSMPRNSLVNGKTAPDSFDTQLDEAAYPILMADQLGLTDASLYDEPHQAGRELRRRARPVVRRRALGGAERLLAVDDRRRDRRARRRRRPRRANGDTASAALWRGVADDWQRSIKGWTVTTNGPLAPPLLHPALEDRRPERRDHLQRRQRRPDARPARGDRRRLPRARAARRAVRRTTRTSSQSLPVVDATIESTTPSGPGWHRYNGDGYGDGATRRASVGAERPGHRPPLAGALGRARRAGPRSRRRRRRGRAARSGMDSFASGVGLIPEQDWELPDLAASPYGTDPTVASIGFANGGPAGSAAPLTWSAGVVRAARGRPRRRPERRAARRRRTRATSRTRRARRR